MTLLGTLVGASAVMAGSPHGYYKTHGVRVPPHPPLPPAKLHYGPKPPSAYPYKRAVYTSHHIPYHHHHPGHYHSPQSKVLIPLRASHHTYQYSRHRPSFPPKPTPPPPPQPPGISSYAWNSNSYHAPVPVEQSFLGQSYGVPSSSYGVSLYNDDRGPIHTIPAPNLGPADKPGNGEGGYTYSSAEADLAAVLNHANFVNAQKHSYQVTEDPSLHQPHSAKQSYFAPDPDPSIVIPKVPTTLDPHSLPSNGQVPLDLYLQQQSEQHQEGNNALTAQDLFNLLNGYSQQQHQLGLLQQGQSQYIQPGTQAFYNPAILLPQQLPVPVQQQFHPHFQTFNYEEQTQQGAHGSDSFPSASNVDMDMERPAVVARNTDEKSQMTAQDLNGIAGNEKNDIYDNVEAIKGSSEAATNQVEFEEDKNEIGEGANDNSFYTTLPNREAAETLATLAAAGSLNSQMKENGQEQQRGDMGVESDEYEEEDGKEESNQVSQSVTKSVSSSQQQQNVDENVQVQKAIRIYETHIGTGSPEPKTPMTREEEEDEVMEYDDREYSQQESGEVPQDKDQSSSVQVGKIAEPESQENVDDAQSQLPFGARLRPKRT